MLTAKLQRRCLGGMLAACILIPIGSASIGQESSPRRGKSGDEAQAKKSVEQPQLPEKFPGPVISTRQFMDLFNKPIYKSLSKSLQSEPRDEDAWDMVEHDSIRVAEVANLIALREAAKEFPEWQDHAMSLQRSALKLTQSAQARSYSAARTAFVGMVRNCNSCHRATKPDHAPQLTAFEEQEQAKRGGGEKRD